MPRVLLTMSSFRPALTASEDNAIQREVSTPVAKWQLYSVKCNVSCAVVHTNGISRQSNVVDFMCFMMRCR